MQIHWSAPTLALNQQATTVPPERIVFFESVRSAWNSCSDFTAGALRVVVSLSVFGLLVIVALLEWGFKAYGETSLSIGLDASGHVWLTTTYKLGSQPPSYQSTNTVQTGLLIKFEGEPKANGSVTFEVESRAERKARIVGHKRGQIKGPAFQLMRDRSQASKPMYARIRDPVLHRKCDTNIKLAVTPPSLLGGQ